MGGVDCRRTDNGGRRFRVGCDERGIGGCKVWCAYGGRQGSKDCLRRPQAGRRRISHSWRGDSGRIGCRRSAESLCPRQVNVGLSVRRARRCRHGNYRNFRVHIAIDLRPTTPLDSSKHGAATPSSRPARTHSPSREPRSRPNFCIARFSVGMEHGHRSVNHRGDLGVRARRDGNVVRPLLLRLALAG